MEDKKIKKNLRLFGKKKGDSLRPDAGEKNEKGKRMVEKERKREEKRAEVTKKEKKIVTEKPREKKIATTKESSLKQTQEKKSFSKEHHAKDPSGKKPLYTIEEKPLKNNTVAQKAVVAPPKNSAMAHIVTAIVIAILLISLALLWPYLPFNKEKIVESSEPKEVIGTTLDSIIRDSDENEAPSVDENGFVVIDKDEIPNDNPKDQIALEPTTEKTEVEAEIEIPEIPPVVPDPAPQPVPQPDPAPQPVPQPTPKKTVGEWGLLYMNTEEFELDDEDSEVTEITLKDVCKSIYKQDSNAVSYCRESSKLKKSTAKSLGKDKCDGGGSCTVGKTCLIWNSKDEDGDLKTYTAMYLCE